MSVTAIPDGEEKETGRVEAFSDGVFGIAMTLLVLEIRVPPPDTLSGHLLDALLRQWPSYVAYVISFVVIAIMWINHHNIFKFIKRTDNLFLLLNALLLMVICLVDFSTALLADYLQRPEQQTAAAVYAGVGFIIAILYNAVWRYAAWKNRLLDKNTDPKWVASINRGYVFGPAGYLLALGLVWVSVPLSLFVQFSLAVFFALTQNGRRVEPELPTA